MESEILTHLNALDSALSTLTRSISTLTPSAPSTSTLISTAHSLTTTLSDLATHQSNVQRIAALQSEATSLDVQLQTQLSTLAELRANIKAAPLSRPAPGSRAVPSSDIVSFARHFARAGPPKGWKGPSALRAEAEAERGATGGGEQQQGAGGVQATPSGSATPALPLGGARTAVASPEGRTPAAGGDTEMLDADAEEKGKNLGIQGLSEMEKVLVNADPEYVPWVAQATMEMSTLRQYQGDPEKALEQWRQELQSAQDVEMERAKNERQARAEEERKRHAAVHQDKPTPHRSILDD